MPLLQVPFVREHLVPTSVHRTYLKLEFFLDCSCLVHPEYVHCSARLCIYYYYSLIRHDSDWVMYVDMSTQNIFGNDSIPATGVHLLVCTLFGQAVHVVLLQPDSTRQGLIQHTQTMNEMVWSWWCNYGRMWYYWPHPHLLYLLVCSVFCG